MLAFTRAETAPESAKMERVELRELVAAYRFLRTTEHRLQQVNDRQTHALPSESLARLRLARSMGLLHWVARSATVNSKPTGSTIEESNAISATTITNSARVKPRVPRSFRITALP